MAQRLSTNRHSSAEAAEARGRASYAINKADENPKARRQLKNAKERQKNQRTKMGTRPGDKTKVAKSGTEEAMTKQRRKEEKDRSQPSWPNAGE